MEEKNLDQYFRKKLDGHSEEPPPDVWKGISEGLPAQKSFWNKRILILLLLFASLGGAAFLGYRIYEMDARMAELEQKIKSEQNNQVEINERDKAEPSLHLTVDSTIKEMKSTKVISDSPGKTNTEKDTLEKDIQKLTDGANLPQNTDHQLIATSGVLRDSDSTKLEMAATILLEGHAKIKSQVAVTKERDSEEDTSWEGEKHLAQALIAKNQDEANMPSAVPYSPTFQANRLAPIVPRASVHPEFYFPERETDYYKKPRNDWQLFVYGMANYTHRRVIAETEGAEGLSNRLNQAENGLVTPGAGLQLSRELTPAFRLSVGVEYNRWTQEGTYNFDVEAAEITIVTNDATAATEYNFNGLVESSLGAATFTSNSAQNPYGEEFTTLIPGSSPLMYQLRTVRTIDYLVIPISLEYVYNAYPFRLTVGGGICLNQILRSDFDSKSEPEISGFEVNGVNQLSGTYLAFQAGIGLEYGLSERVSLRLNPSYRGWMTPVFDGEEFRTLPFGVAVRTGLIYRLSQP